MVEDRFPHLKSPEPDQKGITVSCLFPFDTISCFLAEELQEMGQKKFSCPCNSGSGISNIWHVCLLSLDNRHRQIDVVIRYRKGVIFFFFFGNCWKLGCRHCGSSILNISMYSPRTDFLLCIHSTVSKIAHVTSVQLCDFIQGSHVHFANRPHTSFRAVFPPGENQIQSCVLLQVSTTSCLHLSLALLPPFSVF